MTRLSSPPNDSSHASGSLPQPSHDETWHLLEGHMPWIRGYVHRKLGGRLEPKADTGDIVQLAAIQFLRSGPRFHLTDPREFRALFARIVTNVICDEHDRFHAFRRSMSREGPLPADTALNLDPPVGAAVETPSQIVGRDEEEGWVRLAMELLPEEARRLVILRDWEGDSFAQIAAQRGLTKGTARNHYLDAVGRLFDLLQALKAGRLRELLQDDLENEDR